jgi:hypothetical protein
MDKEKWIAVPSFVLVFFVLANKSVPMQVAYFSYILSTYAFIITITGFPKIIHALKNGFWNHVQIHMADCFRNLLSSAGGHARQSGALCTQCSRKGKADGR